ncbi:D-amino-acid transaminase [Hyphomicrobiales bacterium 4NK60-0047b]
MTRTIYVNGCYQSFNKALLHVEDRATLFADAVYEVVEVKAGKLVDQKAHLERLERSLNEIRLVTDFSLRTIPFIIRETVRRNRVKNGYVYIQISRGCAPRDFIFPSVNETPATLIISARSKNPLKLDEKSKKGIKVITHPDLRWKRPDIKTTGLLASVLARQTAIEQGAEEAWLYNEDNIITEGAASNAWIVTKQGDLITHPANQSILKGITREGVIRLTKELDLSYIERPFKIEEAKEAKEAFITAATNLVMPVTQIDEKPVNDGKSGPISLKLREIFHEFAQISY